MTTEGIFYALSEDLVNPTKLGKYLYTWAQWVPPSSPICDHNIGISLRNSAAVKALYDDLSYATVNLAVVLKLIHKAKWVEHDDTGQTKLDLPSFLPHLLS